MEQQLIIVPYNFQEGCHELIFALCGAASRFSSENNIQIPIAAAVFRIAEAAQKESSVKLLPIDTDSPEMLSSFHLLCSLALSQLQRAISESSAGGHAAGTIETIISTLSTLHRLHPQAGLCPVIVHAILALLSSIGGQQSPVWVPPALNAHRDMDSPHVSERIISASIRHALNLLRYLSRLGMWHRYEFLTLTKPPHRSKPVIPVLGALLELIGFQSCPEFAHLECAGILAELLSSADNDVNNISSPLCPSTI